MLELSDSQYGDIWVFLMVAFIEVNIWIALGDQCVDKANFLVLIDLYDM